MKFTASARGPFLNKLAAVSECFLTAVVAADAFVPALPPLSPAAAARLYFFLRFPALFADPPDSIFETARRRSFKIRGPVYLPRRGRRFSADCQYLAEKLERGSRGLTIPLMADLSLDKAPFAGDYAEIFMLPAAEHRRAVFSGARRVPLITVKLNNPGKFPRMELCRKVSRTDYRRGCARPAALSNSDNFDVHLLNFPGRKMAGAPLFLHLCDFLRSAEPEWFGMTRARAWRRNASSFGVILLSAAI